MRRHPGRGPVVPRAVLLAQLLLAGIAGGHLVVIAVTLAGQSALRADLAAARPEALDVEQVARSATTTALAVHLPLLVLTAALAVMLRTGPAWIRRPAIISQAFAIVFTRLSTPPLQVLEPLVPVAITAAVLVIVLVLLPRESRAFFAIRGTPRDGKPSCAHPG